MIFDRFLARVRIIEVVKGRYGVEKERMLRYEIILGCFWHWGQTLKV